jgi:hypothetical protein
VSGGVWVRSADDLVLLQVVQENLEANYQYWKSKEAKPADGGKAPAR